MMTVSSPVLIPQSSTFANESEQERCEHHNCNNAGLPDEFSSPLQRRRAPCEHGLRAVQVAILKSLAWSGNVPQRNIIDNIAATTGRTGSQILRALHNHDYVRIDQQENIIVAYPFSIRATRHLVKLENGVTVFAMCAIDALGIPPMAHSDATIHSRTESGDVICVSFHGQLVSWDPPETVVVIGTVSPTGAAADVCCEYVNFFVCRTAADAWLQAHPEVTGTILDQAQAVQRGASIFGMLLE